MRSISISSASAASARGGACFFTLISFRFFLMGLAFSAGVEALLFVGVVFMAKSGNEATTELSGVVDGALEDLAEPLLALVLTRTAVLLPLIVTEDLALDFFCSVLNFVFFAFLIADLALDFPLPVLVSTFFDVLVLSG